MRTLVVGAGAVGGPLVMALASGGRRAGIELIRVCDDDVVEASNLQRQVQFTTADIGRSKVERLGARAARREVDIDARGQRFDQSSASELLEGIDLVVDGSDNFASKFLVNDRARAAGITAVIASAISDRGQVFVSVPGRACYRCLFEAPPEREPGTCAQVGVLAPIPGLVAGHAAAIVLELASGALPGEPLTIFPGATDAPRAVDFQPRSGCAACQLETSRIAC